MSCVQVVEEITCWAMGVLAVVAYFVAVEAFEVFAVADCYNCMLSRAFLVIYL
jgi:hypothetical protein